jgi:hypothetical protein
MYRTSEMNNSQTKELQITVNAGKVFVVKHAFLAAP